MSTTILEALRELETSKTISKYTNRSLKERKIAYLNESLKRKKKVSERVNAPIKEAILADLWEQVYCSLTDGGVNAVYQALGDLNGKNKYSSEEVTVPKREWKDEISVISIESDDLNWAKHIAEVYGLKSEEHEGQLDIFVPFEEGVRYDLIVPAWREKIKKSIERANKSVEEDLKEKEFNECDEVKADVKEDVTKDEVVREEVNDDVKEENTDEVKQDIKDEVKEDAEELNKYEFECDKLIEDSDSEEKFSLSLIVKASTLQDAVDVFKRKINRSITLNVIKKNDNVVYSSFENDKELSRAELRDIDWSKYDI